MLLVAIEESLQICWMCWCAFEITFLQILALFEALQIAMKMSTFRRYCSCKYASCANGTPFTGAVKRHMKGSEQYADVEAFIYNTKESGTPNFASRRDDCVGNGHLSTRQKAGHVVHYKSWLNFFWNGNLESSFRTEWDLGKVTRVLEEPFWEISPSSTV